MARDFERKGPPGGPRKPGGGGGAGGGGFKGPRDGDRPPRGPRPEGTGGPRPPRPTDRERTDEERFGRPVADWKPRALPPKTIMEGRIVRLEPFDVQKHARDLYEAFSADYQGRIWDYLPYGPFGDFDSYRAFAAERCTKDDPQFFAIVDRRQGKALGVASYLRITPDQGTIEVGHICFSPALQKTTGATEAMYLMAKRVFEDLGYRRYEWKCNNLNFASKKAAERLGFRFEGMFRNHMVVKGRNRDTAWFAMLDGDWDRVRRNFERWLSPANFDPKGRSVASLGEMNAPPERPGKPGFGGKPGYGGKPGFGDKPRFGGKPGFGGDRGGERGDRGPRKPVVERKPRRNDD